MLRKSLLVWPVVCAIVAVGCSSSPDTPLSPSAVTPASTALNPDGSTLKVNAPTGLLPNGGVIDTLRPTLTFNNATGVYETVGLSYEVEGQNADGGVVYSRIIGAGATSTSHALEVDLAYATTYWWRVRARLGDEVGPWSIFAQFRTQNRPAPPAPPPAAAGALPFPVPAVCQAGNGAACVVAMLSVSPWWPACQAGSGTNCHRFTRSVAAALATGDPNWGLITKNPGEQQCSWNGCGPGDGSGYGEDVVAYHTGSGNWVGWDIVVGAGGPGAGPNWAQLTSRRPGNNWAPVPAFP